MIRTNLATRPFYNEGAVRLWLLGFAVLIVAATIFNVMRVIQYSRSDTELGMHASRDEAQARELRQQAAQLRATVDPKQIEFASNEARQANELIDRRTFSWTELLNRFESTLPDDVRITSVRPKVEKGQIVLTVTVTARGYEDINRFIDAMETSGAFVRPLPRDEHVDEKGMLLASLDAIYAPEAAHDSQADARQPKRRETEAAEDNSRQPERAPTRGRGATPR